MVCQGGERVFRYILENFLKLDICSGDLLTLINMAPVQGHTSMATSSKWPCLKKTYEGVMTRD